MLHFWVRSWRLSFVVRSFAIPVPFVQVAADLVSFAEFLLLAVLLVIQLEGLLLDCRGSRSENRRVHLSDAACDFFQLCLPSLGFRLLLEELVHPEFHMA